MNPLILALAVITGPSVTDEFAVRQQAGLVAAKTPEGQKYLSQISLLYGEAMKGYASLSVSGQVTPSSFVFIAYVDSDGKVISPMVNPVIPVSEYFSKSFSKMVLPKPPAHPDSSAGYPISLEIGLKQLKP